MSSLLVLLHPSGILQVQLCWKMNTKKWDRLMSMAGTFLELNPQHLLYVCEDLLDVHTVGVVGGTVGSLKAGLLEGSRAHPFFYDHVLRFAEGGITTGLFEVLIRGQVLAASHMEVLGLFLSFSLPVVEVVEVGDYDRHWQGYGEYPSNRTQRPHYFTPYGDWVHIPIPNSSHGDHCPPEGIWDAIEPRGRVISLSKIHSAGEQDDTYEEEEDEQSQLPHAGL